MRTSTIVIAGLTLVIIAFLAYAYWPVSGSVTGLQCMMRGGHQQALVSAADAPQVGIIRQLCPEGERNVGEIPGAASVCCKKTPEKVPAT